MGHCSGKDRPFGRPRPGGWGEIVTGCAYCLPNSFRAVWYASTK